MAHLKVVLPRVLGCGIAVAALAAIVVPSAVLAQARPTPLKGAGATFPAPLFYKWTDAYAREAGGAQINYDSVGSGEGVARFLAESVDFGASEARLRDEDIAKVKRGALMLPSTAGLISLAYNLPGLGGELRLTRELYSDIFLGRITRWDDPRIRQVNPGLKLPARNLAVVARLDRSGTTHAITSHLNAVNATWQQQRGVGSLIEWPATAMLARGNEGVASRIKISEGSLGYVEYGFAKRLGLKMALVQNKSGQFVAPDEVTGQSAIADAGTESSAAASAHIFDPPGARSYPIVTFSWLLLYRSYPDAEKAKAIRSFVDWGLTKGQAHAGQLGYIALPEAVVAYARKRLEDIK